MHGRLRTRFEQSYVPYQTPRRAVQLEDCDFYHTVDLAGHGVQEGHWDLRGSEREYLGGFDFAHKRVLDVGAASGALSFYMESEGAEVVAFDTDALAMRETFFMVPYFDFEKRFHTTREAWFKNLVEGTEMMKNGFWLIHEALQSEVKVVYGNIYEGYPREERFDVVILGNVLTHCADPLRVLYTFASIADEAVVVVEGGDPGEGNGPSIWFCPNVESGVNYMSWWNFTSDFFVTALQILGFQNFDLTRHQQRYLRPPQDLPVYTVLCQR